MNRRNVNEMVTNMVDRQYPNLQQAKRSMVINNVSKSIRKDYYILDLNLKFLVMIIGLDLMNNILLNMMIMKL